VVIRGSKVSIHICSRISGGSDAKDSLGDEDSSVWGPSGNGMSASHGRVGSRAAIVESLAAIKYNPLRIHRSILSFN
jgi:hypothetical protein